MCDASEGERSDAWESLFVPFGAGIYNSVWAVAKEKARAADGVIFCESAVSISNLVWN